MIPTIAWRNVWRSPVRSGVVIVAIVLGLALGIFMMAFSWGLSEERARHIIEAQTSHLQLHSPAYVQDPKMTKLLPDGGEILRTIRAREDVVAATARLEAGGMLTSTKGAFGVQIVGVQPESEAEVTLLDTRLVAGDYFADGKRNALLIGDALAEKAGLKEGEGDSASYNLRKRLTLTFQTVNGQTTQARFRVAGVYRTQNSKYDETHVFARLNDLQSLAEVGQGIHEIAVLLPGQELAEPVADQLAGEFDQARVETWAELAPDLQMIAESFEVSMYIFIGIILLALAFGIVNTMLMAVLERTRELGMLMAVGMNRGKVFAMIMLETVFLVAVGGPLGLLAGFGLVELTHQTGIDMSRFAEGVSSLGMSTMVRPELTPEYYLQIALMVIITALVAAIYPSLRALKLRPVEAIRAV